MAEPDEKDMTQDVDAFRDSLDAVEDENGYLGDPVYIASLLRATITEAMAIVAEKKAGQIEPLCRRTAAVLLGQSGDCKPVDGWNAPGGIDVFAAKWCGVDESDPLQRMVGAVARLIEDVIEVGEYADSPGVTRDNWQFQVDALVQQYAWIFIGVSPATMAAIS